MLRLNELNKIITMALEYLSIANIVILFYCNILTILRPAATIRIFAPAEECETP